MFQGMSTENPESPDKPPSDADQAKEDGKVALQEIAKGAATGGWAGAAKGALTAAVKTKTGRKGIAMLIAVPVIVIALLVGMMSMGNAGPGSFAADDARNAASMRAVSTELTDDASTSTALSAAEARGVEWQLLLSVRSFAKDRSRDKGSGPYGLDVAEAGITEDEAKDEEFAANFTAQKISEAMQAVEETVDAPTLGDGAVMMTVADETRYKESTDENDIKRAEESRAHYVAAIKLLPVKGAADGAEVIYKKARSWAMGQQSKCGISDEAIPQTTAKLNDSQKRYAKKVLDVVASRGMSRQAALIVLVTVQQESHFRMYWNAAVPGSRDLTDEPAAQGSDGYSVGLFQQQVHGSDYSWGTVEDAMNPVTSTNNFLNALQQVKGWEDMPLEEAAQAVQRSAFPDAYAAWKDMAEQIADDLWTGDAPVDSDTDHEGEDGSEEPPAGGANHLKVNPNGTKDLKAVEQAVKDRFGTYIFEMGDYRADQDHATYRAVDLMVYDYKNTGAANGDKMAEFFITNAKALGIEYLIWRDRIWLGPDTGWKAYSGGGYGGMYAGDWNDTTKHMDHIHVNVYGDAGTGGELTYTSPEGAEGNNTGCDGGTGIGTGTAGAGDDYPYREPVGGCAWCTGVDAVDPWSTYKRECVSFAAWRINVQMGWKEGEEYPFTPAKLGLSTLGNGFEWKANMAKAGFTTDNNPTPGAVAWWDSNVSFPLVRTGPNGHVAIVQSVDKEAGTVTVEQYNVDPWRYSVMTVPIEQVNGFIHIADIKE